MTSLDERSLPKQGFVNRETLIFQSIAWYAEDVVTCDGDEDPTSNTAKYIIKCFGSTVKGETVSLTITGFTPYFYIKLDEQVLQWTNTQIKNLTEYLDKLSFSGIKSVKLMKRKDFWGFSNGKLFRFMRIAFHNQRAMRIIARKLNDPVQIRTISSRPLKLKVYESNIDPYIRFMHCKELDPTGWIELAPGSYSRGTDILTTNCQIDVEVNWKKVNRHESDESAPFIIASFDIECMSLTGDFPVPKKDYKTLATNIFDLYVNVLHRDGDPRHIMKVGLFYAFGLQNTAGTLKKDEALFEAVKRTVHKVDPKQPNFNIEHVKERLMGIIDEVEPVMISTEHPRERVIGEINERLSNTSTKLPQLKGDAVIQIGTTFHRYGHRETCFRHIITLGTCDPIEGVEVETCESEVDLLLKWRDLIVRTNPDILTGYNIFGFDMLYMYERATDLGIRDEFMRIGRFNDQVSKFKEAKLSSSALGDNFLRFIDMEGRVLIDLMKVIQRDHKLDSYKLDNVASHFMKMNKKDVSPQDIFRLQRGTSVDRQIIADYCVQDCALCNHLMMKLEILANNIGMSNVCLVPLSFIFMRGQGIKIFSLVLKQCKDDGYVIPVVRPASSFNRDVVVEDEEDSYEGAIVLEPKEGVYIDDPVAVLDYASLYPSSMISENLSHDCIVIDDQYNNLPGVEYLDVCYDLYEGTGDKKNKTEKRCRYVQPPNGEKGIIPNILMKLLKARKTTRKKIEMMAVTLKDGNVHKGLFDKASSMVTCFETGEKTTFPKDDVVSVEECFNDFQKAVLDGLQNAYKVTANSLYGQIGAKTSPIYMKDIAACTTATGRKMILMAKEFLEKNYDADVVYGDTDSLFVVFPDSVKGMKGKQKIMPSIRTAVKASGEFKKLIKHPHDLEYEKTFWPFILLSKKRYVGNLYENDDVKFKQKSMGIVLKRRDNAPIVKRIYGGIIDIILGKQDVNESIKFLSDTLNELTKGKCPLEELIITKSLRSEYKDPTKIAHKVLAERIGERDPGNKPQVNDRIPFVYIQPPRDAHGKEKKVLQGERIEHPDYIRKMSIKPDYTFYITNQIMKPVLQVYGIIAEKIPGNKKGATIYSEMFEKLKREFPDDEGKAKDKFHHHKENDVKELLFDPVLRSLENIKKGQMEITRFFSTGS